MAFDKVKEILVEELGCEEADVTLEANVIEDLDADSLAIMQVVMEIEGEFDIEVPEAEVANLKTVGDIVNYITNNA
jgi:acyl carrier protein